MFEPVFLNGKYKNCKLDLCLHGLQKATQIFWMLLLTRLLTLSYIKGRVLATLAQFLMKDLLKELFVGASDSISCCFL